MNNWKRVPALAAFVIAIASSSGSADGSMNTIFMSNTGLEKFSESYNLDPTDVYRNIVTDSCLFLSISQCVCKTTDVRKPGQTLSFNPCVLVDDSKCMRKSVAEAKGLSYYDFTNYSRQDYYKKCEKTILSENVKTRSTTTKKKTQSVPESDDDSDEETDIRRTKKYAIKRDQQSKPTRTAAKSQKPNAKSEKSNGISLVEGIAKGFVWTMLFPFNVFLWPLSKIWGPFWRETRSQTSRMVGADSNWDD